MIILGVDPGSVICGWGIIEKQGNNLKLIEYGVVHAKKKQEPLPARLSEIYDRLRSVIQRCPPDAASFESIFFSKNVQSLVKLSYARGVALLAAQSNNIPIFEYSPREVKKSVTGRGSASKEQVQFMVRNMLNISETPEFFDATDALAVAICHSQRIGSVSLKNNSWKDFIEKNPDRVIRK